MLEKETLLVVLLQKGSVFVALAKDISLSTQRPWKLRPVKLLQRRLTQIALSVAQSKADFSDTVFNACNNSTSDVGDLLI